MTELDVELNDFLVETFGDTHNVVIHGCPSSLTRTERPGFSGVS